RVAVGETAGVFTQPAKGFKLPEDTDRDVIMVGPGTGIAPFRAFTEERQISGAKGRNWMFFGNPHQSMDYFYEEQFEGWKKDGILNRLDLAWSRDQEHKIYVQHLLKQNAEMLWSWIDGGAHFYVCGDATYMAKDVDKALHDAVSKHGNMSEDAAKEYVAQMKKEKRYQRDVY
ncbi:MAG: sulfite reductase subunit alpha, partial [Verrucomicrobiota bacterium]